MSDKFAVVTGVSTGIGFELARQCLQNGYDVLIVANEPQVNEAAVRLQPTGNQVEALEADLSNPAGVDKLYSALKGRPVDALLANAGRGLGHAFLDQNIDEAIGVVETNVIGTIYLIHKIGNDMRRRNAGKILITGSIAGFIPGSFREELKDTKVTVTCLMPGATETEFFRRADMLDTEVGTADKDDPADVAKTGFDAMIRGDGDIVAGLKNKIQSAAANVMPSSVLAAQHRKMAEPGTGKDRGAA